MPQRRMIYAAWYAVGAAALSSPWFDLAPPSAPERVSTLAEARPPHRKIATIKQKGDDGFAVSVDGRAELRFQRVEAAWAASLGAALWPSSLAVRKSNSESGAPPHSSWPRVDGVEAMIQQSGRATRILIYAQVAGPRRPRR